MRTFALLCALLAMVAGLPCAALAQASDDGVYRVGPGDRLEVRVAELDEIKGDFEVSENGTLVLPRIGPLLVRGLGAEEVASRVEAELLEIGLRQANVSVRISEYRSRPVSVLGAVSAPGNVLVRGSMPLFDVLMSVGGLAENFGPVVQIRRRAANGLSAQLELPLAKLIDGSDPVTNIPVYSGDLITVPPASQLTYYFIGEVATAGQQTFLSTEGVTLLTAIARAGGLSDTASSKIRILRKQPNGQRQELEVNYQRILEGREPDVPLQDEDIIVVKESFF